MKNKYIKSEIKDTMLSNGYCLIEESDNTMVFWHSFDAQTISIEIKNEK